MKIIVGLGNPGLQYAGSRHNTGFHMLYQIADAYGIEMKTKEHKGITGKGMIGGEKVILLMPQTYMNLSGESVIALMNFYKCTPEDLIVIYDDIDLDVGKLRIRNRGSAGGHNGIKNIIAHIGTNQFDRIRVGVGHKPEGWNLADYVLGRFSKEDMEEMRKTGDKVVKAVEVIVKDGCGAAMNLFNAN